MPNKLNTTLNTFADFIDGLRLIKFVQIPLGDPEPLSGNRVAVEV